MTGWSLQARAFAAASVSPVEVIGTACIVRPPDPGTGRMHLLAGPAVAVSSQGPLRRGLILPSGLTPTSRGETRILTESSWFLGRDNMIEMLSGDTPVGYLYAV
jgi:hypothetical protein